MEGLKKAWGWIVAAVLFVFGICLMAYFRAIGEDRAAANARADATEKIARKDIEKKQAELETLENDAEANADKIEEVQKDLVAKKEKLHAKFERQNLTADEIAERFRRLRL